MRVAAFLMVVALLFPALAYANEVQEGAAKPPNVVFTPIGGDDGATMNPVHVTADGYVGIIDMVPPNTQTVSWTVASDNGFSDLVRVLTSAIPTAPYGYRVFEITRDGTTGNIFIFLFGSNDGVIFEPCTSANPWTGGAVDTAKVYLAAGIEKLRLNVPMDLYGGAWLKLYCQTDGGSVGADSTLRVVFDGRWD